ncbi:hypothetical protein [Methylobacterium longum]|uniref:Uncharacterized protein n=1 Tax=Methylobacterium longum TaxID=767694 RepID=A0ABT8AJH8_9HYPH|nr:hypothetical protein [Methylobacterium longum]MDN3569979.1 hypothetical protein [Methylobacterium longum]GJE12765.1 hypothetical protein FOHLNKBM_3817 [Methylobacterium longum]
MDAFGFSSSTDTASPAHPAEAIDHSLGRGPDLGRDGSKAKRADAEPRRSGSGEPDLDPSSIAYVAAEVEPALSNRLLSAGAEPTTSGDSDATWTNENFAKFFGDAAVESARLQATAPGKPSAFPPIRVTSGLRASVEAIRAAQATEAATEEAKVEPRRRGRNRKTRAVNALRGLVEDDSRYQGAKEVVAETRRRYDEILTTAASNRHKVDAAQKAFADSIVLEVDFHLSHLASVADRIERCGTHGRLACGSYWCTHCRNRYAARLIEDTRPQLEQRYGTDLEKARLNLLHATILNDIVLPDPDLDREHLADFDASIVRRDAREMLGYLRRWQEDCRSAMSAVLMKSGLSLELAENRIGLTDRDRRFYHPDNVTADADRLIGWNDVIIEARNHFKSRRKRPDLESSELVSCRDDERYEAYLWQLHKATPLNREDIVTLAQGFQCIYREFTGITKTNYPERLKYKSSIEKVMKRERKKLYRINKDDQLPGVSVTGMFELELIDLRHAIGGDHQHSVKAKTLRVLATQERKPTKKRKKDEKISFETERRRMKLGAKMRLLDEARARIAANEDLAEAEFPGLQYAVLLHMHVLIDLNGTPREDLERWLTGKGASTRRFSGQWPLPYQVMVKGLYENKPVDDSIRDISFYAIKAPLTFNYENTAPKRDEDLPESDPKHFSDEALAILAWLQQGIGHERLRIAINWPGAEQEKRGPKPKHVPIPKMTEDELDEALAARGSSLPRPPAGATDIGFLFEEAEEGPQAAYFPEASTSAACEGDASEATDDQDSPDGPTSDPSDRGQGERE